MGRVAGIDLGTSYSCIAVLEGSMPVVIPNLDGSSLTASVVSFTSQGERLIGTLALRQAATNPKNTVISVKRLMGRKFHSAELEKMRQRIPFRTKEAPNGDILVIIEEQVLTPQEISAMILGYLKTCAESYLGETVEGAVITVPAHFDDHQRQATKDAGLIAGLNVLRVINEPTAASLAYGLDVSRETLAAVFDMGGGTFDITVLEISEGVCHVLSTNGDSFLGGDDFDLRIMEWLIRDFHKEHAIDLAEDPFSLQRVREAAEKAKRELSFTSETEIHLPFISSRGDASVHIRKTLTKSRLEELTGDLVEKTVPLIDRALKDAGVKPAQVQDIILVGGQSRMPLIKKTIAAYFDREPSDRINPEEIVALGAAVQSGTFLRDRRDMLLLLDVTPFSLGIETENDTFQKIIERNTTIPTKKTMPFTTVDNDQRRVRIHVLQGESDKASENRSLAVFNLVGIDMAPAGVPQIDVTFEIDADGIVQVSARDIESGRNQHIEIKPSAGLLPAELETIIAREKTRRPSGIPR